MLFRQLEYFVVLGRERHFAHAADVCSVSQPALSDAIRKLERELGVSLVRRGNTFEGLTAEGERLMEWAERILADRDALKQEASAMGAGLTGELHLGLIPAAVTTVAPIVATFEAAHPRVSIHLHGDLASTEIVRRLHHFENDAGVIYQDDEDPAELDLVPLYEERQVLLAPEKLLGDQRAPEMTWAESATLPLCLLDTTMRGRRIVDRAFAGIGLRISPAMQADSIAALCAHVATGRWATIIPHTWSARPMGGAAIRMLELTEPVARSQVWLATSRRAGRSPIGSAFVATAETLLRPPDGSFAAGADAEEEPGPVPL